MMRDDRERTGAREAGGLRILMVGCGKMGEAMLSGWLDLAVGAGGPLTRDDFTVVTKTDESARSIAERYGVEAAAHAPASCDFDMVVLAVKPQNMAEATAPLRACGVFDGAHLGPLVVSVMAGVGTETLADDERGLGRGVRVVRAMPNMPLRVKRGMTAIAAGRWASESDLELVRNLFDALGETAVVPESQIDAVCALSGGGPAYFAYLVELLAQAGARQGLEPRLAYEAALQTAQGTFDYMRQTGADAESTRVSVCSPGGTTLAALEAMEAAGFEKAIDDGIDAAVRRAKELAR